MIHSCNNYPLRRLLDTNHDSLALKKNIHPSPSHDLGTFKKHKCSEVPVEMSNYQKYNVPDQYLTRPKYDTSAKRMDNSDIIGNDTSRPGSSLSAVTVKLNPHYKGDSLSNCDSVDKSLHPPAIINSLVQPA